jgi:TPR repeat protein
MLHLLHISCLLLYIMEASVSAHAPSIPIDKSRAQADLEKVTKILTNNICKTKEAIQQVSANVDLWQKELDKDGSSQAKVLIGCCYHYGIGRMQDTKRAFSYFTQASERKCYFAYFMLSKCYEEGTGTAKNDKLSFEYAKLAAENGLVYSHAYVAYCYHSGVGVRNDAGQAITELKKGADGGSVFCARQYGFYLLQNATSSEGNQEAIRYIDMAARSGDSLSECIIGRRLLDGTGIPKDEAKGVQYLRRSALRGHSNAMITLGFHSRSHGDMPWALAMLRFASIHGNNEANYYLGVWLTDGIHIKIDHELAAQWFAKASDAGHIRAACKLAEMYITGTGVKKNVSAGLSIYEKCALDGDGLACSSLGVLYLRGVGVDKDIARAFNFISKSHDRKCAYGTALLGLCYEHGYGTEVDRAGAYAKYVEAAKAGDAYGALCLALANYQGTGCEVNYASAFEWMSKSAFSNVGAQYYMGKFYEDGVGVTKDVGQAVQWYRKAASKGNDDAKRALSRLQK